MDRSESIVKLTAALIKFQTSSVVVAKDSTNPHFRSSYADLAAVREAVQPLNAVGIAVVQHAGTETVLVADGTVKVMVSVETVLLHESGEWISSRLDIPVAKADAQGIGSGITYARRYALLAITGMAPADEDDDGEGAMGRSQGSGTSSGPRLRPKPDNAGEAPAAPAKPPSRAKHTKEELVDLIGQALSDGGWDKADYDQVIEEASMFEGKDGARVFIESVEKLPEASPTWLGKTLANIRSGEGISVEPVPESLRDPAPAGEEGSGDELF